MTPIELRVFIIDGSREVRHEFVEKPFYKYNALTIVLNMESTLSGSRQRLN